MLQYRLKPRPICTTLSNLAVGRKKLCGPQAVTWNEYGYTKFFNTVSEYFKQVFQMNSGKLFEMKTDCTR